MALLYRCLMKFARCPGRLCLQGHSTETSGMVTAFLRLRKLRAGGHQEAACRLRSRRRRAAKPARAPGTCAAPSAESAHSFVTWSE